VIADEDRVLLEATDLKTSIRCVARGIRVSESGSAILPVRLLGELFKKASSDAMKIDIRGEKGVLSSGRNRTRFTTWPASDFPKLPRSDGAELICDVSATELLRTLSEGSIASSTTDDFPKYLGACLLQVRNGSFQVVSTDGRRLSLSKCPCDATSEAELLLPLVALRELQRLLGAMSADATVRLLGDGSLAWFQLGDVEFSVRRIESSFPSYERILNPGSTTTVALKKEALLAALDRVDVIVRSYTRMVVMQFSPGGQVKLTGRAPEFGTAVEFLDASVDGEPLRAGFNVGFLQDGLKSLGAEDICMNLNGDAGQMTLTRKNADDFLYMLMPMRVADQDLIEPEEDENIEGNRTAESAKKVEAAGIENPEKAESDEAVNALLELRETVETRGPEIPSIPDANPDESLPF
jgi:DNA polymerase-3 subunit beta